MDYNSDLAYKYKHVHSHESSPPRAHPPLFVLLEPRAALRTFLFDLPLPRSGAMATALSMCRSKWVLVFVATAASFLASSAKADLQYGFYNTSCPGVEELVRAELNATFGKDTTLRAGLLRLHFHDCFVRGCDASIMLNSHNATAEKDADPNLTVRGYEAIEAIKAKVEAACPLVVSCADIMAMAARDAVYFVS